MGAPRKSALAIVAGALALGLAPDPVIKPSVWAAEHLVVADGPRSGHRWAADLTPYAVEILDCLAVDGPYNRVSVRKSAQTGLTEVGIAWVGSIIDKTPAKTMVVFPTILAVQDFNREKLSPTIEATDALLRKVRQHKSRSGQSSTALNKRFPGGSLVLTGANSAADLRSKTIRFAFCDEIDEWPIDLDGQGDPMKMVDARQMGHHASADYMKFEASTPTIKGQSRIDESFEAGDQRYFHVPCPHCDERQRLEFGTRETPWGLKFSTEWPFNAHYVCRHCGCVIEHHQKRAMVLAGEWVAENPGPGRHPSFHIDALTSLLTTWDKMVEAFLDARDDPGKLKTFYNLWLGQAWEERGEAPEWDRLFARREDYAPRTIPPGGLVFTGGADVQGNGIYYEIVAWADDQQSWGIDAGFLPGDTADPHNAVWTALGEVVDRRYPDAYGNYWPVDAFAVDSGFNANQVYMFASARPRVFAIKGGDGWAKAAISSSPSRVSINWDGKRLKGGAELWHVGTWPLKAVLYANLRKQGKRDGAELDPPGFCHFSGFHDEAYLKQLTAEFLRSRINKGRTVKEWHAAGPNHYHDCRIYNMAMAAHLGVDRMTAEEWHKLARLRGEPPKQAQGDLLARMSPVGEAKAAPVDEKQAARTAEKAKQSGQWLPRTKGWLG